VYQKANGKILLTGEYFILDGAVGLALPTLGYGQTLTLNKNEEVGVLTWSAADENDEVWFFIKIQTLDFQILSTNNDEIAHTFVDILKKAKSLNADFLNDKNTGIQAFSVTNFPRIWGLGTSSTLTSLIADWANIDAFALNDLTFKSSGYDVACAKSETPIFFQKRAAPNDNFYENTVFEPSFVENLYFVHLTKKQNSREGITHYRKLDLATRKNVATQITTLTYAIAQAKTLADFDKNILLHENLIAETLHLERAKNLYFQDFWGEIKSLGAWGGDFVLATSDKNAETTVAYFHEKGFATVFTYEAFFAQRGLSISERV
jgi:mevalonate kinase